MAPSLIRFADSATLVADVTRRWLAEVRQASQAGRRHSVALPGGRVAGQFLAASGREARAAGLSWKHVDFFWADERCVPPESTDSNFKLAQDGLFAPCAIDAGQIFRLRGELSPPDAARVASDELRRSVPVDLHGVPALELVFLGMGEDGHVASLFPNASPEVIASQELVLPVIGPKPPPQRLTFTFRLLAAAKQVWVLASGAGKADALRESLAPRQRTPLGRLLSQRTTTTIFTDISDV
jgi:6-phosphogluconolactonase